MSKGRNPVDWGRRLAWALPVLAAVAAFARAPAGGLVWDDAIVLGQQLPAIGSWREAFLPPPGLEQWSPSYYRPLVVLSYLADRALFGDGTVGPHVSNVLFHAFATLAVFVLLRRLLAPRPHAMAGALAGACVFAVHPVHVESVSWISGRSDVLAALLLVPAVTLALSWRDTRSPVALCGSACAVLGALLAKEVAMAAVVLIPAAMLLAAAMGGAPAPTTDARHSRASHGVLLAAISVAIAIYVGLRWWATPAVKPAMVVATDPLLPLRSLAFLVQKSVWPWPQTHFVPPSALPGAAATMLACLAIVGVAAWSARTRRRGGDGLPLLAVLWFLATAAPAVIAGMLQVAAAPVAERYAYLPSIGVALLVGIAVAHAAARAPRVTLGVAALLVVALGAATMQRTLVWQSDEALWSDAAAKAPDEAHPLNELAVLRERRGDLEGALDLWLRARPLTADRQLGGTIDGNIGVIHFRRGEYAKAREYLESGLRLHPDQFNAQRTLGAVLYTQAAALPMAGPRAGDARVLLADSRANYETALRLSPGSIPARLELALVLARLGDLDARAGRVREATGLYREALSYLEWVFARQPATAEVPATRALADALRAAVRKSAR